MLANDELVGVDGVDVRLKKHDEVGHYDEDNIFYFSFFQVVETILSGTGKGKTLLVIDPNIDSKAELLEEVCKLTTF